MTGKRRFLVNALLEVSVLLATSTSVTLAGPFAPPPGQLGSEAISKDDPLLIDWATAVAELIRGPMDIASPAGGDASFGTTAEALGPAEGTSSGVVSLGDGGRITLFFERGIRNEPGFDFTVFENGFADDFLELAFVEVSSNGTDFFRFDSVSLTQTTTQVGGFDPLDTTNIDNLAGKYRQGFGTPFDLEQLSGISPALDVSDVSWVRVIDVVGSIDPAIARFDSLSNVINDPYPTAFSSGGFDLDAIGVIHRVVPEPGTAALAVWCVLFLGGMAVDRRRRSRHRSTAG